jgi:hypothetical protein
MTTTSSFNQDTIDISADTIDISMNTCKYDSMTVGAAGIMAQDITSITIPTYTVGSAGSMLSSTGSSFAWNQDYSLSSNIKSNVHITGDGITMESAADIKIGDRSLKEFMNTVDEHLAILRPAPELEEKWDQLKDLRQQYETLKADILEKEKIMTILKKA